jgi:RNA polymerase sigma-70 factor (ECF subfamily)
VTSALDDLLRILEANGPSFYALFARLALRADAADELLQELFLKLHRSEGFQTAKNRTAYAYRAAMNLAFDWRRARRAARDSEPLRIDPVAECEAPLKRLIDSEDIERILDALAELPELSRSVLIMRYLDQQDYASIAKHVEKTEHQVRALCAKGLTQVRAIMQAADECSGGEVLPK